MIDIKSFFVGETCGVAFCVIVVFIIMFIEEYKYNKLELKNRKAKKENKDE